MEESVLNQLDKAREMVTILGESIKEVDKEKSKNLIKKTRSKLTKALNEYLKEKRASRIIAEKDQEFLSGLMEGVYKNFEDKIIDILHDFSEELGDVDEQLVPIYK